MKYVVIFSAVVGFFLIFVGVYYDIMGNTLKHQFYGSGTVMIFIITFPLFLLYRMNKTNITKYIMKRNGEDPTSKGKVVSDKKNLD